MADRVTGLGETLEDHRKNNPIRTLGETYDRMKSEVDETKKHEVLLGDITVKNDQIFYKEDGMCIGHNYCLEQMGKALNFPEKYIGRISIVKRAEMINYHLKLMSDKKFVLLERPHSYVEVDETRTSTVYDFYDPNAPRIELLDVYNQIIQVIGRSSELLTVDSSSGFDLIDLLIPEMKYKANDDVYYGGLRLVFKKKFQAPEISTIFIAESSCGIIECSYNAPKLTIRDLTYDKILKSIYDYAEMRVDTIKGLAETIKYIQDNEISNIRKRVDHLLVEHGIKDRIAGNVATLLNQYKVKDGSVDGTFGELLSLFSTAGFKDSIKLTSKRDLHKLAGFIVLKSHKEDRCDNCDALLIEDTV